MSALGPNDELGLGREWKEELCPGARFVRLEQAELEAAGQRRPLPRPARPASTPIVHSDPGATSSNRGPNQQRQVA